MQYNIYNYQKLKENVSVHAYLSMGCEMKVFTKEEEGVL